MLSLRTLPTSFTNKQSRSLATGNMVNSFNYSCSFPPITNHSSPTPLSTAQLTTIHSWCILSIVICFSGSFLLILLLVTSFLHRHRPAIHNSSARYLLIHLLSLELFLLLISHPLQTVLSHVRMTQPLLTSLSLPCRGIVLVHASTTYAENWSILAVALNRFIALEIPVHYDHCSSPRCNAALILIPWIIGVGCTLPAYFGARMDFLVSPDNGGCYQQAHNTSGYLQLEFAAGVYVPIVLTGVLYFLLLWQLTPSRHRQVTPHVLPLTPVQITVTVGRRTHVALLPPLSGRATGHGCASGFRARQIAVTRMLLVSFVWYCVCFVPGPIVTASFPQLFSGTGDNRWKGVVLQLWLTKTLLLCGYAWKSGKSVKSSACACVTVFCEDSFFQGTSL